MYCAVLATWKFLLGSLFMENTSVFTQKLDLLGNSSHLTVNFFMALLLEKEATKLLKIVPII